MSGSRLFTGLWKGPARSPTVRGRLGIGRGHAGYCVVQGQTVRSLGPGHRRGAPWASVSNSLLGVCLHPGFVLFCSQGRTPEAVVPWKRQLRIAVGIPLVIQCAQSIGGQTKSPHLGPIESVPPSCSQFSEVRGFFCFPGLRASRPSINKTREPFFIP